MSATPGSVNLLNQKGIMISIKVPVAARSSDTTEVQTDRRYSWNFHLLPAKVLGAG